MTEGFEIKPVEWLLPLEGPPEIRNTSCAIRMQAGGHVVTRVIDRWSRSTRDHIYVSAFPLAKWIAESWWRLMWEPASSAEDSVDWRLCHELAAAGYGYLWPMLRFASDGETVEIVSAPLDPGGKSTIRYVEAARTSLPIAAFEHALDQFVAVTLTRLGEMGPQESGLRNLWLEIRRERNDFEVSNWRRLEARLGCDPGDLPDSAATRLQDLANVAGLAGRDEIASACGGRPDPEFALARFMEFAESGGIRGHSNLPRVTPVDPGMAPWEKGYALARNVRQVLQLNGDCVLNHQLDGLLGTPSGFVKDGKASGNAPSGLVVREGASNHRIFMRRTGSVARRFEAARLVADMLVQPATETWLPATDVYTSRQKLQRAFAAEFLAPVRLLESRLGEDVSEEAIADAADSFGVSSTVVDRQLENARRLRGEAP